MWSSDVELSVELNMFKPHLYSIPRSLVSLRIKPTHGSESNIAVVCELAESIQPDKQVIHVLRSEIFRVFPQGVLLQAASPGFISLAG